MNIVGKILIILNLVFAVVVGGLLVFDVATRTNWKRQVETLDRELRSAHNSLTTSQETVARLQNELKDRRNRITELEKGRVTDIDAAQALVKVKETELETVRQQLKDAELNSQKALAEAKRFVEENFDLKKIINKRDAEILVLVEKYQEMQKEQLAQKDRADALQARAASLIEDLRFARQKIAETEARGGAGTPLANGTAKDPYQANPPSRKVKGKIERIHADDRSLVEINVGLDDGVNKDHTLEVFRLSPNPEYLGMIRILEADPHTARGRLIRNPYAPPAKALKAGDQVANSLK